jgi:DNA-binding NtrC family response regulator
MKMDLEDLRTEFENYRGRHPELASSPLPAGPGLEPIEIEVGDGSLAVVPEPDPVSVIHLTPDMTMDDVEREAIRIALEDVGGNRRKAAERLGIGERTLYRKLRQYELED